MNLIGSSYLETIVSENIDRKKIRIEREKQERIAIKEKRIAIKTSRNRELVAAYLMEHLTDFNGAIDVSQLKQSEFNYLLKRAKCHYFLQNLSDPDALNVLGLGIMVVLGCISIGLIFLHYILKILYNY